MNNKLLVLGLDAAVLAGLMGVLIAVVGLDALLGYINPPTETQAQPAVAKPGQTKKVYTNRIRLAVTRPFESDLMINGVMQRAAWDHVGKLLDEMGDGYRYDYISESDLLDLAKLKQYDVVFCS